ncbi:MAG: hypothetical protein QXL94_07175 [Candidatus Parvarchaeum sp.]
MKALGGIELISHGILLISFGFLVAHFFLIPLGIPSSDASSEIGIGYALLFIGLIFELGGTFDLNFLGALFGSGIITFIAFVIISII